MLDRHPKRGRSSRIKLVGLSESVIVVLRVEELYAATDNGLLYGYKVHTPGGPPGSANHPRGPAML